MQSPSCSVVLKTAPHCSQGASPTHFLFLGRRLHSLVSCNRGDHLGLSAKKRSRLGKNYSEAKMEALRESGLIDSHRWG